MVFIYQNLGKTLYMNTKTTLAKSIDFLALCFAFSSILFLWSSFIPRFTERALFSTSVGCGIVFIIKNTLSRLNTKNSLSLQEKKQARQICETLLNSDPKKIDKFFFTALQKKFETTRIDFCKYETTMQNGETAIFISDFISSPFTKPELIKTYINFFEYKKIFILCPAFDHACLETAKRIPKIILLNEEKIYKLLKFLETLPQIKTQQKQKFLFIKQFTKSIKHDNGKQYLKISILFLLISIFVTSNIIYRIFTSITFLLSVCCFLKKQEQPQSSQLFFE